MVRTEKTTLSQDFVFQVKLVIAAQIEKMTSFYRCTVDPESLMPGKMLRTRLAAQLAACDTVSSNIETLVRTCVATELVHTASLCHDDVIDNGLIRRGLPTIWKITGPSCAVLTGDLLLCEAIDVLLNTAGGCYVAPFVSKVREICIAEIEQEIALRGERLDEHTCMRLARGKTGPLFVLLGLYMEVAILLFRQPLRMQVTISEQLISLPTISSIFLEMNVFPERHLAVTQDGESLHSLNLLSLHGA